MAWVLIFFVSFDEGAIARIAPQLFSTQEECLLSARVYHRIEPRAQAVCVEAARP
jgi:hypothetical protein